MRMTKRRMVRGLAMAAAGAGILVGIQAGAANGLVKGYARLTGVDLERATVSVAQRLEYTCKVVPATVLAGISGQRLQLGDLVRRVDEHTAVIFEARVAGSSCRLDRLQIVDGMPE